MTRFLKGSEYYGHRGWIIVSVFVVLASSMVTIIYFGNKTLSGVQVLVAGEGRWHKAQKEAVVSLLLYNTHQTPSYYDEFQRHLSVLQSYRAGREAVLANPLDRETIYEEFIQAGHDPNEVDRALWIFQNFLGLSYLEDALKIWESKDKQVRALNRLATQLHQAIQRSDLNRSQVKAFSLSINSRNKALDELCTAFRANLEQASDWVRHTLLWASVGCGLLLILISAIVIVVLFRNINTLAQSLATSRAQLEQVLGHSQSVLYKVNIYPFGPAYDYISPYVESMLGYTAEDIIAKGPEFIEDRIHPQDREQMKKEFKQLIDGQASDSSNTETEYRLKTAQGSYIWINDQRTLLRDRSGKPYAVVGSVQNISERKRRQLDVKEDLQHKQLLLEEIHHRIKNNLAIVSSMIELQKADVPREVRAIFEDVQSRIQTIALIHEKLYQSKTLSDINMREYITELATTISTTYANKASDITIATDLEDINLELSEAIPLGLILNELLNNAYKHAFTNLPQGTLRIQLKKQGDQAVLSVADDGGGLPEDFDLDGVHSLGMTLVKTFSQQIEGNVCVSQNGWTKFSVEFSIPNS